MFRKMFIFAVSATALSTALLVTLPAHAQGGPPPGSHGPAMMHGGGRGPMHAGPGQHCCKQDEGHPGGGFFLRLRQQLGLSEDQVAKLSALKSETAKQAIRTKADVEILRIELRELMHKDNVDVKAVDAKINKIGDLQTALRRAEVHARLEARNVLTEEQLKKLHELKGKRRKHRGDRGM